MDRHPDQPVSEGMIEALRQFASANEKIAKSLANLENLYAEDLRRQEQDRQTRAIEMKEWKEKQNRREAEAERELAEHAREAREGLKMPPMPWSMRLFWWLLALLIFLFVLLLSWHLVAVIRGEARPLQGI